MERSTRERWIDYVKVVACCLVVLGHFFQSMVKAGIMEASFIYKYFNTTIYCFHVPLFFVCSGYLYQKYSKVTNVNAWLKSVKKKGIAFGIPYIAFSLMTLFIKNIFESVVNTANEESWIEILFNNPISPYWYLYVLFFVFVLTPTASKQKQMNVLLAISILMKILVVLKIVSCDSVYAVNKILANEIWFVMGMSMGFSEWNKNIGIKKSIIIMFSFSILSALILYLEISNGLWDFLIGVLACISFIGICNHLELCGRRHIIMDILSRYTLPIFLMHTIFAAGLRSVLLKIGIDAMIIHFILGIGISFLGPIFATYIMQKSKWLEIFIYPGKFIK